MICIRFIEQHEQGQARVVYQHGSWWIAASGCYGAAVPEDSWVYIPWAADWSHLKCCISSFAPFSSFEMNLIIVVLTVPLNSPAISSNNFLSTSLSLSLSSSPQTGCLVLAQSGQTALRVTSTASPALGTRWVICHKLWKQTSFPMTTPIAQVPSRMRRLWWPLMRRCNYLGKCTAGPSFWNATTIASLLIHLEAREFALQQVWSCLINKRCCLVSFAINATCPGCCLWCNHKEFCQERFSENDPGENKRNWLHPDLTLFDLLIKSD